MAGSNFYLDLLAKQVKELETTINSKEQYTPNTYNCILAGIIIRMNAILEQVLIDFHSLDFQKVADLIYTSRQILIHYASYKHFSNLEDNSKKIVDSFKSIYKKEQAFFENIMGYYKTYEHNVIVKKHKNIVYDEFTNSYIFTSENVKLLVDASKIIRIQDLKKKKDLAYIVNCEEPIGAYFKGEDGYYDTYFEFHTYGAIQKVFKEEFFVEDIDYSRHHDVIRDVLNHFYKQNNYNDIYIKEVVSAKSKKQPIFMEVSKVLDKYFNDNIIYKQFIEKREYNNYPRPIYGYDNYGAIRDNCKEKLEANISSKDYFFLVKALSRFSSLNDRINKNVHLGDKQKEALKTTLLINWCDNTIKNFTKDFIETDKEFSKLYFKLLGYRDFFAHNLLQVKPKVANSTLDDFYELVSGFVEILASLQIESITRNEPQRLIRFVYVERNIDNFISYKGEQYLKIDDSNYVGDKLFYASKEKEYSKVVGLLPVDSKFDFHSAYYKKEDDEFVAQSVRSKAGKKRIRLVSRFDYSEDKEVYIDVNCTSLLDIYASLRGKMNNVDSNCNKKVLVFLESQDNNNHLHASYLDDVISDFFKKRYLPFELAREIKCELVVGEGLPFFKLFTKDNRLIGLVMDIEEFKNNFDFKIDKQESVVLKEVVDGSSKRRI